MDYPSLSHMLSTAVATLSSSPSLPSSTTPKLPQKRSHTVASADDEGTSDDDPIGEPQLPVDQDPAYDPSLLSPQATQSSYSAKREVSMIETYSTLPSGRSTGAPDVGDQTKGTEMEGIESQNDGVAKDASSMDAVQSDPRPEVSFNPPLSLQRTQWALDVLRREGAGSVLDMGCGEGALLEVLCQPAATIPEDPIRPAHGSTSSSTSSLTPKPVSAPFPPNSSSSHTQNGGHDEDFELEGVPIKSGRNGAKRGANGRKVGQRTEIRELFLHRIAGLDVDPTVIPKAVAVTAPLTTPTTTPQPPSSSSDQPSWSASQAQSQRYVPPRWQRTDVEIWNGGLERHNHRLEGYEAIVALEVIEHLDQPCFDILPQIIFGTYRPPLVLITTPNFEFNSKFPRVEDEDCMHSNGAEVKKNGVALGGRGGQWGQRGFLDPTGRTERVFRHSDHKLEMTEAEFRSWAEAAEEWGYSAEISGIGISNTPSYHDGDVTRPLYATQTAIFRRGGQPTRSPRSVRTAQLPFIGGGEAMHPHKLAARHTHEPRGPGEALKQGRPMRPASNEAIISLVRDTLTRFNVGSISISELWGVEDISRACAGSKRKLVSVFGGYGDVEGVKLANPAVSAEFEVIWPETEFGALSVRWKSFAPAQPDEEERWGTNDESTEREVEMDDASGW